MTTPLSLPYGPHWGTLARLPDVTTVETPALSRIRLQLDASIQSRSIMVITGKWGAGKSYALARAVEDRAPSHNVDVVWLEMKATRGERDQWHELHHQVAGTPPARSATIGDVVRMLQHELSERPRLIVVDEAQEVKKDLFKQLRWLHDHGPSDFALVFAGTPDLWDSNHLPGEVKSRAHFHVRVHGLSDEDAATLLPKFHPTFAAADAADLRRWNRTMAHGSFRWWARVLEDCTRLLPHLGGLLNDDAMRVIVADAPERAA